MTIMLIAEAAARARSPSRTGDPSALFLYRAGEYLMRKRGKIIGFAPNGPDCWLPSDATAAGRNGAAKAASAPPERAGERLPGFVEGPTPPKHAVEALARVLPVVAPRRLPVDRVRQLIDKNIYGRFLGAIEEPNKRPPANASARGIRPWLSGKVECASQI